MIEKELQAYLGENVYIEEAPEDAGYPYTVLALSVLSSDDEIDNCRLELNHWDKHRYYSRADALADAMERKLDGTNQMFAGFHAAFYKSQRGHIGDPDKQIKRVRAIYQARIVKKED